MPTPDEIEHMRWLRQQEWSYKRISERMNIPYATVLELIKDGRNLGSRAGIPSHIKAGYFSSATGGRGLQPNAVEDNCPSGEPHHFQLNPQDADRHNQPGMCKRCGKLKNNRPFDKGGRWTRHQK
jgi:hypothetical protein